MKILISLPLYKREWILPQWLKCIENQTVPLSDIGFQFELGPNDEETHDILWEWQSQHPECFVFDAQINESEPHRAHDEGKRQWKRADYLRMATLRNNLMERACLKMGQFDRLFSLDSDILLENPKTIEILAEHDRDVVEPLMFMTPNNTAFPNSMNWHRTEPDYLAKRNLLGKGLCRIDVPMAGVMMKPHIVENVRYMYHRQGEDIGFASNLHRQGYKSYLDHDLYTPHIMSRKMLRDYLLNGDSRALCYY